MGLVKEERKCKNVIEKEIENEIKKLNDRLERAIEEIYEVNYENVVKVDIDEVVDEQECSDVALELIKIIKKYNIKFYDSLAHDLKDTIREILKSRNEEEFIKKFEEYVKEVEEWKENEICFANL